MARILPVDGEGGKRGPTRKPGARRRKAQRVRSQTNGRRVARPAAREPGVEPVGGREPWSRGGVARESLAPLTVLDPAPAPHLEPLALTGAGQPTPPRGHAHDQPASRIWRRPGGLIHLAGL